MPNLDRGIHAPHPTAMPTWDDTEIRASKPLIQQNSAIQEDRGGSRLLIITLVLGSLLLCGVGAFFFFTLG